MSLPMIKGILDLDWYKLLMMQAIYHNYPNARCSYRFVNRSAKKGVKLGVHKKNLEDEVLKWAFFKLTPTEAGYLLENGLAPDFVKYLSDFRVDPGQLLIKVVDGDLDISTRMGKWVETIWFETCVLASVNELESKLTVVNNLIDWKGYADSKYPFGEGYRRLDEKIKLLNEYEARNGFPLKIMEFGTRRRYSSEWQEEVLLNLWRRTNAIVGTSNVYLAMKYGIPVLGTMAHEFISGHLGLCDGKIEEAQTKALVTWFDEFKGKFAFALSDTFTTDAFLRDMGFVLTSDYLGFRHDSGCPFEFGRKSIRHYLSHDINPKTKSLIFSDGLDIPLAIKIADEFTPQLKSVLFGIGTNLTNDFDFAPLSIVMKLVEMQANESSPVVQCVKLSDNPEKAIGDADMVRRVKEAYKVS